MVKQQVQQQTLYDVIPPFQLQRMLHAQNDLLATEILWFVWKVVDAWIPISDMENINIITLHNLASLTFSINCTEFLVVQQLTPSPQLYQTKKDCYLLTCTWKLYQLKLENIGSHIDMQCRHILAAATH